MIKTHLVLLDELKSYASPATKIARMVKNGELTRIVRGLYETDPHTPGYLLAASIYGPSYLSFEYALAYFGLIPEAVRHFTSATFEKKKAKQFETPFGVFSYRDIPEAAFPYGILPMMENGYSFRLATAEKAVCDELYKLPPCVNRAELEALLFDNLRIDRAAFLKLDLKEMEELASLYQTKNHKLLTSWIRKEMRHAAESPFIIDFNETEIRAMEAFAAGNGDEGEALQDQFLEEIRKERKEGTDFCPCPDASCKHHGICWECVQIHRGHGMHLPFCMQKMVNRRLAAISELTEHTIVNEVSVPEYLRKPGTDSERSREGA